MGDFFFLPPTNYKVGEEAKKILTTKKRKHAVHKTMTKKMKNLRTKSWQEIKKCFVQIHDKNTKIGQFSMDRLIAEILFRWIEREKKNYAPPPAIFFWVAKNSTWKKNFFFKCLELICYENMMSYDHQNNFFTFSNLFLWPV